MEKMMNTAKKLDTFFKIFSVICTVGIVAALVCLGFIGIALLFKLPPEQIGTNYHVLDFGILQFTLTESVVPEVGSILTVSTVDLLMGLVFILLGKAWVHCIRDILHPMTEGLPFQGAASANLKKLSVLYMVMGLVSNCMDFVNQLLIVNCYDLVDLFIGDNITHVNITPNFDLDFLLVGAVLLLLSYVFAYGEQLQQLSDETL